MLISYPVESECCSYLVGGRPDPWQGHYHRVASGGLDRYPPTPPFPASPPLPSPSPPAVPTASTCQKCRGLKRPLTLMGYLLRAFLYTVSRTNLFWGCGLGEVGRCLSWRHAAFLQRRWFVRRVIALPPPILPARQRKHCASLLRLTGSRIASLFTIDKTSWCEARGLGL